MTIMHELSDYELAGRWANLMDIENGAMTDEGSCCLRTPPSTTSC